MNDKVKDASLLQAQTTKAAASKSIMTQKPTTQPLMKAKSPSEAKTPKEVASLKSQKLPTPSQDQALESAKISQPVTTVEKPSEPKPAEEQPLQRKESQKSTASLRQSSQQVVAESDPKATAESKPISD